MARYVPNSRETGHFLRTSRALWRVCEEAAGDMADIARAIAPVDEGEYKAGIRVERMRGWDGRVGAAVVATAGHSASVEFGNSRVRAQAPLARAAALMEAYQ